MNSFEYTDFYNEWLGQSSQLGGNYNQCVTLFKEFLNKAGYPDPGRAIGGSGGAREIWYRKDVLGYGDYFEYTQVGQPGDWFIWDSNYGWYKGVYYGHVAMLIKDNGNGTGQFLGMNQDYSLAPASVQTLSYTGSCGVLRYKGYGDSSSSSDSSGYSDSQLIDEHAIATLTVNVNKRRDTPTGIAVETLQAGTSLEYTSKWVGNGHRYISFVENQADGASYRYFVAVNGNEAGTDPWATFSSVADTSTTQSQELTEEHGWAKYKVDNVNVRSNSPTGDIVGQIMSGQVVEYSWKCVTSENRYIVRETDGVKYYMACSPTSERSTDWADFYSSDPDAQDTSGTTSDTTDETNGFTSVNEGEVESPEQTDETLEAEGVTVDLIPSSLYSYKCPYVMTPKTIVIHNAATPNGTAKTLNNAQHNNQDYKSWHFSVDDTDIIQSLPLNRNAFATGDGAFGYGNRTGIHIEIAKDNDVDNEEEWTESKKNGAKLTAILLKRYGWTIDQVSKHQDYKMTDGTYKYCPHKILDEGWEDFLKLVQTELDELNTEKQEPETEEPDTSEPDTTQPTTEEKTDKTNTLFTLLIKLIKKLLKLFK